MFLTLWLYSFGFLLFSTSNILFVFLMLIDHCLQTNFYYLDFHRFSFSFFLHRKKNIIHVNTFLIIIDSFPFSDYRYALITLALCLIIDEVCVYRHGAFTSTRFGAKMCIWIIIIHCIYQANCTVSLLIKKKLYCKGKLILNIYFRITIDIDHSCNN